MRLLARWTIGEVHPTGLKILEESVNQFAEIYPEFERVVCFNCKKIQLNAELIEQNQNELPFSVGGSGWKLTPPRLNVDGYELWLDNDIVINKRVPTIDSWLNSDTSIITEGKHGLYGAFKSKLKNKKLCAGIFGLPPGFDFLSQIIKWQFKPLTHCFDEQGLTSLIVSSIPGYKVIPLVEIGICEDAEDVNDNLCGIHFVGANRGNDEAWKRYLTKRIKLI